MRAPILNQNDPGLFRNTRGIRGDDPRMLPDGDRVPITTGETDLPSPASQPGLARAAFDPNGVGLGVIVMLALLFVIHGRLSVSTQAAVGTR